MMGRAPQKREKHQLPSSRAAPPPSMRRRARRKRDHGRLYRQRCLPGGQWGGQAARAHRDVVPGGEREKGSGSLVLLVCCALPHSLSPLSVCAAAAVGCHVTYVSSPIRKLDTDRVCCVCVCLCLEQVRALFVSFAAAERSPAHLPQRQNAEKTHTRQQPKLVYINPNQPIIYFFVNILRIRSTCAAPPSTVAPSRSSA
jgi:hypothetical protein